MSRSHHCGHGRCHVCGDEGEARRKREADAQRVDGREADREDEHDATPAAIIRITREVPAWRNPNKYQEHIGSASATRHVSAYWQVSQWEHDTRLGYVLRHYSRARTLDAAIRDFRLWRPG